MPEKPWKRAERQVAERLGGERLAAHGRGALDVETSTEGVEVKLRKKLPEWLTSAVLKTRERTPPTKLPIVVLVEGGHGPRLVLMDIRDFEDWFGPIAARKEE